MKKKKKEILQDIATLTQDKEITPDLIRKYLKEELHLSKASVYRFFFKDDNEDISYSLEAKTKEKRDNIDYSDEEYESIVRNAFDILHKDNKNSSSNITINEIRKIAEIVGTTDRFLSCNVFGIDTKAFDRLVSGELKSTKISLGLGFKDPVLAEAVRKTKHELIKTKFGESFSLDDIKSFATEKEIPITICLKKVFCLTRAQILGLQKEKKVRFSSNREFIDYEYNDLPTKNDFLYEDIEELTDSRKIDVLTDEDLKDNLYENVDFYEIESNNQDEFIDKLNEKRKYLNEKREYLTKKYDKLYKDLLDNYKSLNIPITHRLPYNSNSNEILDNTIFQIKEIIKRNPKYYEYYPPKLKINDFEEIAKNFNIDSKYLAYRMFGTTHYNKKINESENKYFEIPAPKLPMASNFYRLFQKELDTGIKKIAGKIVSDIPGATRDIAEDIAQILRISVFTKCNNILFYGRQRETKEEYLGDIFAYLKVIGISKCKDLRSKDIHLNDTVKEGSDTELGDFIPADKTVEEIVEDNSSVGNVISMACDEDDRDIIKNMIGFLGETGNREDALKKLAEQMGISVEKAEEKLKDVYSRLK